MSHQHVYSAYALATRRDAPVPADRGSPVSDADIDSALAEMASTLASAVTTARGSGSGHAAAVASSSPRLADEELFGSTPLQRSLLSGSSGRPPAAQQQQQPQGLALPAAQVRACTRHRAPCLCL